jgi:predicted acyltransferase
MSDQPAPTASARLVSLDVFRGITIAAMILVNNPGEWGAMYSPLGHAKWHGWTPTDLIFPFFLFIVGVAMTFSFDKRLARGDNRVRLMEGVLRRTIILFCLGLIMYGFPNFRLIAPYILLIVGLILLFRTEPAFTLGRTPEERINKAIGWALTLAAIVWWIWDFSYFQTKHPSPVGVLRVPGVLQRIALCYLAASVVMLWTGVRGRVIVTLVLLVGYWLLLRHVSPPASYEPGFTGRPEGLLHDWLDQLLLGEHLYRERPDPEGLLSTVPAIATTLIGILTGTWLHSARDNRDKALGMFFAGNILIVAGLWWGMAFPINKKIWTSSYVLLTGGIALEMLAMCFWLIDVKGRRVWSWPFFVFGTNAITVFFLSGLLGRWMTIWQVEGDRGTMSLKNWIYTELFRPTFESAYNASLAYAAAYLVLWFLLLLPLYRRRIFIKI